MPNVGLRIYSQINRPPKALIDGFAGIPVANIADNMNRMSCIGAKIRPFNEAPLLGPAFTVRTRPGDNLFLNRALDLAEPGDIIVVDVQGDLTNAVMGELMTLWAKSRKIGGFIIDGAIRDVGTIRKMDIPVYAAGVTPAGPYKDGPGEINVPINCGGVVVQPGDILAGDEDGVVVINPLDAEEILEKARATMRKEQAILRDIVNVWDRTWIDKRLKELGVANLHERRGYPQAEVSKPVTIQCDGDQGPLTALAVNISNRGMLLKVSQPLDLDKPVRLRLPIELGNIEVMAQIIWNQGNYFGCKFMDMSSDVEAILDFVTCYHLQKK